jgi:N-methylhydantoinase B
MPEVDPITLEVVKNLLASTADEMALVIMRSAYSPVVRDTLDYSSALCDRNGRIVAQGLTLAVQLGTFPTVMAHVLEELAPTARPGDVYIANDPYGCGGQHLPDLYVIQPVFVDGALEGYAATMAHHSDIGGIAPGSIAVHATEIYQEGLRIPLSKLVDAGVENTTLMRLLEANTRQPTHVLGDLRAQLAACRVGEHGLTALVQRYGADAHRYTDELQRVAERTMRTELARLPDGVRTFTDFIDGVGDDPTPIPISVRVEIVGDEASVDFEGTSLQVDASVNCPVGMVYAACYCAFRGIVRADIPNCEGYMAPIHVHAPPGTVVNPELPAACGARGVVGYRVYDAVMGALASLVPDRVVAAGEGGPTLVAFGGYDRDRRPFGTTEVLVGSWGARANRDGLEGVSNPLANLGNQPVELIEADQPLRVDRYGLMPDSGGAGRRRGGLAYVRRYTVLAERATLTIRTDRRDHPPYGLDGGEPGAPSANVVCSGDRRSDLPTMPMNALVLEEGDSFTHVSAGGGGFGSPFERDADAVLEDVLDGKVSVAAARGRYGVIVADGEVDATETAKLRACAGAFRRPRDHEHARGDQTGIRSRQPPEPRKEGGELDEQRVDP